MIDLQRTSAKRYILALAIAGCALLVCSFIIISIVILFLDLINVPYPSKITELAWSSSKVFINVVVITAIYEELKYRLILVYSPLNFSVFVSIWFFYIVAQIEIIKSSLFDDFYLYSFSIFALSTLLYFCLSLFSGTDRYLSSIHTRIGKTVLVFLSSVLFCVMHTLNYDFEYAFQSLVLLPHFFVGIFFALYRLRYGIFFSIILHALINSVPFAIHN